MYIVKTLKVMNYLVRNGFDCVKIEKDRYKEGKVVFCFEDSKELRESINKREKI